MPLYDYHCEECGPFRAFRSIADRVHPTPCEACGAIAARVLTAPQLNLMSSNARIAETRNEKSAHEPGVVNVLPKEKKKPVKKERGKRKSAMAHGHAHAHRPWMIGH